MRRRSMRLLAAALLALILPVQGLAAACAQICASVQDAQMAAAHEETGDGKHCDNSIGAGKCCKAHTFMIAVTEPASTAVPASLDAVTRETAWASFIPEVPDRPPTSVLLTA